MIEILTVENSERWDSCVKKIINYDAFYLSSYLKAFQLLGAGQPFLAVYSNEDDYAVNAFFKRDIAEDEHFKNLIDPQKFFDIITPYGYGGFIGSVKNKAELLKEWNAYCINSGFISEFIRFNLFTDYKDYFDGTVETLTHNVVRNLEMPIDDIWMDFKQKVRKNVKRAKELGLEIIIENTGEHLEDFLRIYYGTMDRTYAANGYYFSKQFFETLTMMKDNFTFFHVKYQGRIISTELVIYGAENAYSYLGGTDKDYFQMRPNDFLKYEVIKWVKAKGLKNFVLGGGYGSDDGIFRYKSSFAPRGIKDFYIGKKIFDMDNYKMLCRLRGMDDNDLMTGYFPKYRGGGGIYRLIPITRTPIHELDWRRAV